MNKRIWLALIASTILVGGLPGHAVAQSSGPQAASPDQVQRAILAARYAHDPRLMLLLQRNPAFLANRGLQLHEPQVRPAPGAAANTEGIITFDVPGASCLFTSFPWATPVAINPAGVMTGFYYDASVVSHGFVRASDGAITTFDAPGAGTIC